MGSFKTLLLFRIKNKLGLPQLKYKIKHTENGALYAFGILLFIFVILSSLLIPYVIILSFIYDATLVIGNTDKFITFITSSGQILMFFAGLFYSFNSLFGDKESDSLLALPLRKNYIFLTSFLISYIMNYVTGLVLLMPGLLIYYIETAVGPLFLLKGFFLTFLYPIIPMCISMLIVLVVVKLSNKFRHKEAIGTIFGFVLIGLFLLGNMAFSTTLQEGSEASVIASFFRDKLDLPHLLGNIVRYSGFMDKLLIGNMGAFLLNSFFLIALCSLLFGLVYFVGSIFYQGIIEKISFVSKRQIDINPKKIKTRSPVMAFCKKEIVLVLRSPIYALNSLVNVILGPIFILSVFVFTKNNDEAQIIGKLINEYSKKPIILTYAFIAIVSLITAMNVAPSSTFSREGKNIWITKVIPVPYTEQVKGRILASVLFYLLCAVPMLILLQFYVKLPLLHLLMAFVIICFSILEFTHLSILIDVIKPKLNWTNEAQAIKRNINTLVAMLLSYVLCAINVLPIILFNLISPVLCFVISLIVSISILVLLRYALMRAVSNRYSNIYI